MNTRNQDVAALLELRRLVGEINNKEARLGIEPQDYSAIPNTARGHKLLRSRLADLDNALAYRTAAAITADEGAATNTPITLGTWFRERAAKVFNPFR